MSLRDHINDLVKSAADEVHELEFGDRPEAGKSRAESGADDGSGPKRSMKPSVTLNAPP
jgi:hypothetical protein